MPTGGLADLACAGRLASLDKQVCVQVDFPVDSRVDSLLGTLVV